jgi:hypothetical protein
LYKFYKILHFLLFLFLSFFKSTKISIELKYICLLKWNWEKLNLKINSEKYLKIYLFTEMNK